MREHAQAHEGHQWAFVGTNAKNGLIPWGLLLGMLGTKRGWLWHPTLPGYGDKDVLICVLTPLMATTCFKAMMLIILSELYSWACFCKSSTRMGDLLGSLVWRAKSRQYCMSLWWGVTLLRFFFFFFSKRLEKCLSYVSQVRYRESSLAFSRSDFFWPKCQAAISRCATMVTRNPFVLIPKKSRDLVNFRQDPVIVKLSKTQSWRGKS